MKKKGRRQSEKVILVTSSAVTDMSRKWLFNHYCVFIPRGRHMGASFAQAIRHFSMASHTFLYHWQG